MSVVGSVIDEDDGIGVVDGIVDEPFVEERDEFVWEDDFVDEDDDVPSGSDVDVDGDEIFCSVFKFGQIVDKRSANVCNWLWVRILPVNTYRRYDSNEQQHALTVCV